MAQWGAPASHVCVSRVYTPQVKGGADSLRCVLSQGKRPQSNSCHGYVSVYTAHAGVNTQHTLRPSVPAVTLCECGIRPAIKFRQQSHHQQHRRKKLVQSQQYPRWTTAPCRLDDAAREQSCLLSPSSGKAANAVVAPRKRDDHPHPHPSSHPAPGSTQRSRGARKQHPPPTNTHMYI